MPTPSTIGNLGQVLPSTLLFPRQPKLYMFPLVSSTAPRVRVCSHLQQAAPTLSQALLVSPLTWLGGGRRNTPAISSSTYSLKELACNRSLIFPNELLVMVLKPVWKALWGVSKDSLLNTGLLISHHSQL